MVVVGLGVVNTAMPMPVSAAGPVAALDLWPAAPQMTGTTGNPGSVTFAISAGTERLLVVLVCDYDSTGVTGQTFAATYGGKTLTQAFLENSNRRQTWIAYLNESDIASRTGNTVTVTVTGTHTNVVAYIASYSGVDQTMPIAGAGGTYVNNTNNVTIGGPLNVNAGGYGIYGWSGTGGITRTTDTETYTERSDVNNAGTFNYGVAHKTIAAAGTTNPNVQWSGNNRASVSFITLNPSVIVKQRGTPTTANTITTTLTISKPTGVIAGDVLLANIAVYGDNTTAPTSPGWKLLAGADLGSVGALRYGAVLYKVASSSENATYTFTLGPSTTNAVGTIVAFTGVDVSGATPFDAVGALVTGTGNAVTTTQMTTVSANAPVIMFGEVSGSARAWSGWTTTSPGTLTELYDNPTGSAQVGAAWGTKPTAGRGLGGPRL